MVMNLPKQQVLKYRFSIVPKRKNAFTGCGSKISKQFTRINGNL
jgi:hypothetical protein